MKIIVRKYDKVVVFIGEKAEIVENGIDVGGLVYGGENIYDIFDLTTLPNEVKAQKYKFKDGVFVINDGYQAPYDMDMLIRNQNLMQKALDELLLGGGL